MGLTKLHKQIILTVVMLAAMVLVTSLTGLLGKMEFIKRSPGDSWAGIYVSLGDMVVYLSVLVLGGPLGALVSAVGGMIGDIILGAPDRIIGSLIVRASMAFFVAAFCRQCTNWKRSFVVAGIAESIMVIGYFVCDLLIMREFAVAAQAFLVDIAQGIVCGLIGALVLRLIRPMNPEKLPRVSRKLF